MKIVCKDQGTHEWYQARIGKITGTGIARAMDFVAKGSVARGDKRWESSADRNTYIRELAWEIITREPTYHFVTKAMEDGNIAEPEARREYEEATGTDVTAVGFVVPDDCEFIGCSPDGLIPSLGKGLEIKCPQINTHQKIITQNEIPQKPMNYVMQMQMNMLVTGYEEWDFCSYAHPELWPNFPDPLRVFIIPLKADKVLHEQMMEAATATMEEVLRLVQELMNRFPVLQDWQNPNIQRSFSAVDAAPAYDSARSFAENCEGINLGMEPLDSM